MKKLLIPLLVLGLTGCQLLGGGSGGAESTITSESINTLNNSTEIVNQQFTTTQLLIFAILAGWAIPGPFETLKFIFGGLFSGVYSLIKLIKGVV